MSLSEGTKVFVRIRQENENTEILNVDSTESTLNFSRDD